MILERDSFISHLDAGCLAELNGATDRGCVTRTLDCVSRHGRGAGGSPHRGRLRRRLEGREISAELVDALKQAILGHDVLHGTQVAPGKELLESARPGDSTSRRHRAHAAPTLARQPCPTATCAGHAPDFYRQFPVVCEFPKSCRDRCGACGRGFRRFAFESQWCMPAKSSRLHGRRAPFVPVRRVRFSDRWRSCAIA